MSHVQEVLLMLRARSSHIALGIALSFTLALIPPGLAQDLGSIEPSKMADLVVLSKNPLRWWDADPATGSEGSQ